MFRREKRLAVRPLAGDTLKLSLRKRTGADMSVQLLETRTAPFDIPLLVADDLTLEQFFAAMSPVEELLSRKVNPSLYTREEFRRRRYRGNAFLKRVLNGPVIPLVG